MTAYDRVEWDDDNYFEIRLTLNIVIMHGYIRVQEKGKFFFCFFFLNDFVYCQNDVANDDHVVD